MKFDKNQLFRIDTDPNEKLNIIDEHQKIADELLLFVRTYDSIQPTIPMPDYGVGREGFVAPKEWKVQD